MMLWEIGDKDSNEDETNEDVGGRIRDWKRRIDVH